MGNCCGGFVVSRHRPSSCIHQHSSRLAAAGGRLASDIAPYVLQPCRGGGGVACCLSGRSAVACDWRRGPISTALSGEVSRAITSERSILSGPVVVTAIEGGFGASSYYGYTPNYDSPSAGGSGGGCSGHADGTARSGGAGTSGQGYVGGGNAGGW